VKVFGFGGSLDDFAAEQDRLKGYLLEGISARSVATVEDLASHIARRIAQDDNVAPDPTALEGVIPGALARATHEGLVEMTPGADQRQWKLSGKGQKLLRKRKLGPAPRQLT
jgi:hypothetical protein